MNLNRLFLPIGVVSAAFFSACAPLPPNPNDPSTTQTPEGAQGENEPITSDQQKQLRDQQDTVSSDEPASSGSDDTPVDVPAPPEPKTDYPRGLAIPGKPGFVFNPYNNNPVDVRGIPPGTLVIDPADPEKDKHKFRVP